jgi:hypothetical protein
MYFFIVIILLYSYILTTYVINLLFIVLLKYVGSVLKNQKNSFLLQTAILIFAILLKLTDENIL